MTTTLSLGPPPSINALWRNGKGRTFRSHRYISWLRDAGWELRSQKPARFTGPVTITVAAGRPDNRKRDLDNIATKAVLDLLVAHRVLIDDSLVTSLAARWDDAVPAGRITVTIESALERAV